MKTVSLSGSPRENVGKKDAAGLRAQGRIPCVIYGNGEQVHLHLPELAISKVVFTPDVFLYEIELEGGKTHKAMIQDLQFHPVTDKLLHVDFLEVSDDKPAKISLPVILNGTAIGVRNGGRMSFPNRTLRVQGLPKDFPDAVTLDVEKIRIGMKIRVSDISIPGLTILAPEDMVIFAVRTARGAMDDEEEEEEGAEAAEGAEGGEGEAAKEEASEG